MFDLNPILVGKITPPTTYTENTENLKIGAS